MGVKKLDDLVALQLASEFKREVYRLVRQSDRASRDFKFRDQLFDAASSVEANITEGWHRYVARDFALFLRYASGSIAEARLRLRDGIDRGHFAESECEHALALANRCAGSIINLHKSLQPFSTPPRRPRAPR
jgi:four helix bundle protein